MKTVLAFMILWNLASTVLLVLLVKNVNQLNSHYHLKPDNDGEWKVYFKGKWRSM